jgi:hypothetical protein
MEYVEYYKGYKGVIRACSGYSIRYRDVFNIWWWFIKSLIFIPCICIINIKYD